MEKMDRDTMSKMRRWIDAIAAEELAGLIVELLEFISSDVSEKILNKVLFKLLQYLSHAAYKFHRTKKKLGDELSRLCNLLCTNISSVSDTTKFFGSIYHIIACLSEMSLYFEAMAISNYLLPTGILSDITKTERTEIHEQTSCLWFKTSMEFAKITRLTTLKDYDLFIKIVNYQLDLTTLQQDNYSRNLLTKIAAYWKKIRDIFVEKYQDIVIVFKNFLLDYIEKSAITLKDEEDSPRIWRLICELLSTFVDPTGFGLMSFSESRDPTSAHTKAKHCQRIFDVFRPLIKNQKYYIDCYNFHENLCKILVKPVEKFSRDGPKEIFSFTKKLGKFVNMEKLSINADDEKKTDYNAAIQCYAYAILPLLMGLLNYWEKILRNKETMKHGNDEMLMAILSLSKIHEQLFQHFEIEKCCTMEGCKAIKDHYNSSLLSHKCLCLISHCPNVMENPNLRELTRTLAKKVFTEMDIMKKFGCGKWRIIWHAWGIQVYNMGVTCESKSLETSAKFYEMMIKAAVIMMNIESLESLWGLDDPIGTILHRLYSVYMRLNNYEKAEFVCSINGILSYNKYETKSYRDWSMLRYKYTKNSNTTMLQYLRNNEKEIRKIIHNFSLDRYDLDMLCYSEIKGFEESRYDMSRSIMNVLDEHSRINGETLVYCHGVKSLGYHLLDHQRGFPTMSRYIVEAKRRCEQENLSTINYRSFHAMMEFYEFMIKLEDILKKTENEMKSSQFGQYPSAIGGKTYENGSAEMKNIVPAYSTINMKITSELMDLLENSLKSFSRLIDEEIWKAELEIWEFNHMIRIIVIAGEYSRLYNFQNLETIAWKLSYELCKNTENDYYKIYTIARSLTSDNVNLDWINEANEFIDYEKLASPAMRKIITIYQLCLANFYYENDEPEMGKKMLNETNERIIFLNDLSNFLIKLEIEMNHCLGYDDNDDQTKYTCMIVQYLYTILSMDDSIDSSNFYPQWGLQFRLYDYGILLDFTNNLALRMNGLLSYREITAHLVRRLRTAQKLCLPLRIAECLKYLCYLDLSRAQLEECESKLEGLEHILEIEAFGVTMRSRAPTQASHDYETTGTGRLYEPVRDLGQNDASPILRKKVFAKPDFMLHGHGCACFKCTNTRYQYLVFACTHIRAQLFALQRNKQAALQHFHGALLIKSDILANEVERKDKRIGSAGARRDAIEWVMLHVDYSRFLKWSMPNNSKDGMEIAQNALELCNKYHLKNHPIFMAVQELVFEYTFENVFTKQNYSKFIVPDIDAIDTSHFNPETLPDPLICVTPVREMVLKPAISVRRRKTPPFLKLDRVPGDFTNDETPIIHSQAKRSRPVRRKISEDEDYSEDDQEVTIQRKKPSQSRCKPITPKEAPIIVKTEGTNLIESRDNSPIAGTSSILKGSKIHDEKIIPADKINDLATMIEDLRVKSPIENATTVNSVRTRLRKREPRSSESDLTSNKIDGPTKLSTQGTIRQKSTRSQKVKIESEELSVIEQSFSSTTISGDDSDLSTKRVSSRLRKKIENLGKMRNLEKSEKK